MILEEKDYAEALGVELPEAETAAEPADTGSVGDSTDNGTGDTADENSGVDNGAGDGGEDPSVDPNASAAARRRAMESRIERERERAKQEERARMIAEIRRANAAKATSTAATQSASAASTSPARDSSGRFARRTQQQEQSPAGTGDDLSRRIGEIVDSHPAVVAAKQYTDQMRENEVRTAFAEDLAKITEMDPSIKTEEDLLALPEHDLILGLVNKGYSPSDAYKTVFFEKITAAAVERGKRQAEAKVQSVSHQVPDKHRGTGGDPAVQVPDDVRQMYREMMPGISDADIVKHYAKFRK